MFRFILGEIVSGDVCVRVCVARLPNQQIPSNPG